MTALKKLLLLSMLGAFFLGCATRHEIEPAYASSSSGIRGRLVTTTSSGGAVSVAGSTRGRVKVTTADETRQVATVDTDSDGNFDIGLRPGKYFVYTEPMDGMFYGRKVAVAPSQMTNLELRLPRQ